MDNQQQLGTEPRAVYSDDRAATAQGRYLNNTGTLRASRGALPGSEVQTGEIHVMVAELTNLQTRLEEAIQQLANRIGPALLKSSAPTPAGMDKIAFPPVESELGSELRLQAERLAQHLIAVKTLTAAVAL